MYLQVLNFKNVILKIWYEEVWQRNLRFGDSFFAGYFNGIQNLKLQNIEILTRQLCQLASDNAFALVCLTAYIIT